MEIAVELGHWRSMPRSRRRITAYAACAFDQKLQAKETRAVACGFGSNGRTVLANGPEYVILSGRFDQHFR